VPVIVERTLRPCTARIPWRHRVEVTVRWFHPDRPELDGFVRYRRQRRSDDVFTTWTDRFSGVGDDLSRPAGRAVTQG
jgi:hypothetical protein